MVKCFVPNKHASKTQEFNYKMNVVQVNLEVNMGCIMDECFILSLNFYGFFFPQF
jgi:hypothetical protein